MLDKEQVRSIVGEINAAVAEVLSRHNMTAVPGSVAYSPTSFRMKLEATVVANNEAGVNAASREAKAYELLRESYGLDAGLLGVKFKANGKTYTFIGLTPSRTKFPFDAIDETGRRYKFTQLLAPTINAAA